MKKKGFTLVELLVVIAIIALLMSILMPALARVRAIAFRMVCGSNLSGIGKAMLIYANDYEDELPRAGGKESIMGGVSWNAADRNTAYGLTATGTGGQASLTSCFYLLVKFAEVTPKSFVCKSDSGCSEFKLMDQLNPPAELIQAWDFGATNASGSPHPRKHCSYSYHQPLPTAVGTYPYTLTTSSEPGMAVAADKNPWMPIPANPANPVEGDWAKFKPAGLPYNGQPEEQREGNSAPHQKEGQNVLFLDGHVYFEKRSYCAMEEDNLYTSWTTATPPDKRKGIQPATATYSPRDRTDSLLINDSKAVKTFCFPADTQVWVDGALVQISKVTTGQAAGKFNCVAATSNLEQIESIQEHEGTFECRDIVLDSGNSISVVDSHYFQLDDGQWVAAQNLTSGSKLKTQNGSIDIKSVTKRTMPFVGKVYNLKVKSSHQYLVGQDAVVVRDY